MESELKDLRIDRSKRRSDEPSPWAVRWIVAGVAIFALLGLARFIYGKMNAATEVEIVRVHATAIRHGGGGMHANNFDLGGGVHLPIDKTNQAEQREDRNAGHNPAHSPRRRLIRAALRPIDPQVFEFRFHPRFRCPSRL